jgi:hypothetical protein
VTHKAAEAISGFRHNTSMSKGPVMCTGSVVCTDAYSLATVIRLLVGWTFGMCRRRMPSFTVASMAS